MTRLQAAEVRADVRGRRHRPVRVRDRARRGGPRGRGRRPSGLDDRIARRYLPERAEQYAIRNDVPGETLVRLVLI